MDGVARWLERAQWLVIAAMFIAAALAWPSAPEQMPVHWNLGGQPDRFGGRLEGLFGIPLLALVIAIVLQLFPRIDPLRSNYVEFRFAYAVVRLGLALVMAVAFALILMATYGVAVNTGLVIAPAVGALLVLIGLVIGQVRRNWLFGIRTPWTLSSEQVWTTTHRAGRWVFIAMGLAIALAGVLQTQWALVSAMVICLAGVVGLVAYSYLVWRRTAA
jgi:uncharacterized membrane protein